jgi:hypothetical protein
MHVGLSPKPITDLERISSHLLRDRITEAIIWSCFLRRGTSIPPARPPLPYWPHEYGYTFAAAIRGLYLADFDGGARRMHRRMRPARLLLSIAVT